jgi:hypothetical protein
MVGTSLATNQERRFAVMKAFRNLAILLLVMSLLEVSSFAQAPLQQRVNFTINVPYRLTMQNYMLPPGNYTLFQINQRAPGLFALYEGDDMMHSPIAMIQTVRIEHNVRHPDKTSMHWHIGEFNSSADPVVTGWDIPGCDGWQIVSVVPSHRGRNLLTRVY